MQLAAAMTVIYYLAAHIGLALLAQPGGIAVFWPASGIAAGALIALGRQAMLPIAAGVAVGTLIANIEGRSDSRLAAIFAACNAIECVGVAAAIGWLFGPAFDFDRITRVVGFIGAGLVATAVAAFPAALALHVLADAPVPLALLWSTWMQSDAIGVLAVAPIVITLPGLLRDPPPVARLVEGIFLLILLGGAAFYLFGPFSTGSVGRLVPLGSALFPILLWIAARGPPAFGAAAAAVLGVLVVVCTIKGIGALGDSRLSLDDRVRAAQLIILIATLCALSLAALFAEQRRAQRELTLAVDELRLLSSTLEERVEERSQALVRVGQDRLAAEMKLADYRNELAHVQRVATAGELATFIAHEVNQPLNAISSTAAACVRMSRSERLSTDELAQHLGDIAAQAQRASDIIRQLRQLVRKEPRDKAAVDLGAVVEQTLPLVRSLAERGGIEIEFERQPVPALSGNAIQLGQLVLNLVRNALDAVAPLPDERRRIGIKAVGDAGGVRLEIDDQGPGLTEEARMRMFEPFFTEKKEGLGIGLSICQTIAEAHGGKIEIEAGHLADGGGTRVRVVFPAATLVGDVE